MQLGVQLADHAQTRSKGVLVFRFRLDCWSGSSGPPGGGHFFRANLRDPVRNAGEVPEPVRDA